MRTRTSAFVSAEPEAVFRTIADLTTWPRWLDVVARVHPLHGDVPAWRMRLGVRVGPVDVGRDIRLVTAAVEPHRHVRFVRQEDDGRTDHSAVELDVAIEPRDGGAFVTLEAHVGKRLPFFDLEGELARRGPSALAKLEAVVTGRTSS